jgi:hypothetical protein
MRGTSGLNGWISVELPTKTFIAQEMTPFSFTNRMQLAGAGRK